MSLAEKYTTLVTEKIPATYEAGYEKGKAEGGGSDSWYDTFWDAFQDNGNRTDYNSALRSNGWNDVTFIPKYKMFPERANYMFSNAEIQECDLEQYVDFSNCTTVNSCFSYCLLKRLPTLNFTSITSALSSTFAAMSNLETIEKIIMDFDSGITFNTNTFNSVAKLKEIRFEGVIKKDIYLQHSPLSVESMKDIISHLANHKGTANEGIYTVSFSSKCWEALEESGVSPIGGTWKDYVYSLGWLA